MESTDEFSFVLRPSKHGIGVFATIDIKQGTHLRLFGDNEIIDLRSIERPKDKVPEAFRDFCMDKGDVLICPEDFSQMHVGWYLNHSKNSNTYCDSDYKWYASKDIKVGEEILIDYNSLNEPLESKPEYYKN